jgi:hypothetical protein
MDMELNDLDVHSLPRHVQRRVLRSFIDTIECQCRKVYAPCPTIEKAVEGVSTESTPRKCLALRVHCPNVRSLIDDPDFGGREDLSGFYHCLVSLPDYEVLSAEPQSSGLDDRVVRDECWATFLSLTVTTKN